MDLVYWTLKGKFWCVRSINTQRNKAKRKNDFLNEKWKKNTYVLYIIIHLKKGNENVILETTYETKNSSLFHWQYNL